MTRLTMRSSPEWYAKHRTAALRDQCVDGLLERRGKDVELVVDLDAQRLEGSARGMTTPPARRRRDRIANHFGQLGRRVQGTGRDDRSGDTGGEPLIAVRREGLRQSGLVVLVHDGCGRARLGLIHPHVERTVVAITETTLGSIELRRTDAQIEEHAAHRVDPLVLHDLGEVIEARFAEPNSRTEGSERRCCCRQCVVVLVQTEQFELWMRLEQRPSVSPASDRAVDQYPSRYRCEEFDDLSDQHGLVSETGFPGHVPVLPGPRS